MGLTNPVRALGRSSLLLISPKLLTLSSIPCFTINSFRLASPSCFACCTQSFLSDRRACMFYHNHKSRSFRVHQGVPQGSVLGPVLFSLFINDLPDSLPSTASCSLYTDDLAIWSSSPSVPTAVEATQEALFRLECWSDYWCFPLNPRKCEPSFFSVDPTKLASSYFNPTPTFRGITFDRTLSFSEHYLR